MKRSGFIFYLSNGIKLNILTKALVCDGDEFQYCVIVRGTLFAVF